MKKSVIILLSIFVIILLIVSIVFSMQLKSMGNVKQKYDEEMNFFLQYENKKFNVNEFISIMNKAIENNEKHDIALDKENLYVEDDKYSIKIYLQLDDREELIPMEVLMLSEQGGSKRISTLFSDISYSYDTIEYHKETGRIKKIVIYGFTKQNEVNFTISN